MCTTLVCVLFVATPTYTISVYYFSMCVYPCVLSVEFLLLLCTALVCVLFVATPTSTITVYYFSMVKGNIHYSYDISRFEKSDFHDSGNKS